MPEKGNRTIMLRNKFIAKFSGYHEQYIDKLRKEKETSVLHFHNILIESGYDKYTNDFFDEDTKTFIPEYKYVELNNLVEKLPTWGRNRKIRLSKNKGRKKGSQNTVKTSSKISKLDERYIDLENRISKIEQHLNIQKDENETIVNIKEKTFSDHIISEFINNINPINLDPIITNQYPGGYQCDPQSE